MYVVTMMVGRWPKLIIVTIKVPPMAPKSAKKVSNEKLELLPPFFIPNDKEENEEWIFWFETIFAVLGAIIGLFIVAIISFSHIPTIIVTTYIIRISPKLLWIRPNYRATLVVYYLSYWEKVFWVKISKMWNNFNFGSLI